MVSAVPAVVGRDRELSRLLSRVADLATGRGAAVLVEGEPGIGKTTLVRAARAAARSKGLRVLSGSGDELGQLLPLLPLLEALPVDEETLRLLRGETSLGGDPTAAAAERLLALVDQLCARGPVLLTLDDLQWADSGTVMVWRQLTKLVDQLPLLLIATMRPVPAREDLLVLSRQRGLTRMPVGPLPDTAVGELVRALVGAEPGAELLGLAEGAAGNPLYVKELVEALGRGATLPGSLFAAIENRLGFLSEHARHVLRAAALLGVEFTANDLSTVLGQRVADLVPVLDEARSAGVVEESGDGLSFRHPMVRTALYEGMSATVRAAWHADVAKALAAVGAPVERIARQLLVAAEDGWTVDWLVANADALIGHAPSAAADLLRRVMSRPGERPAVLAHQLADALYRVGEAAEAEQVAEAALDTAVDAEHLVRLHATLAQCRVITGNSARSLDELARALRRPGLTGRVRARLLALTARTQWDLGESCEAERAASAVLDEPEPDLWATGWALHVRSLALLHRGQLDAALPLLDRALRTARSDTSLADLRLLLQINYAITLAELDRTAQAHAAVLELVAQADEVGNLVRLAQAQCALGQLLHDTGRWDEALVAVDLLAEDLKNPIVSCCDHGIAALIHLHRGHTAAAQEHLDAVQAHADHPVHLVSLAQSLAHEQAGRLDEALAVLAAGTADDVLPEIVRLAVAVGDNATAARTTGLVAELAADSVVPHRVAAHAYCAGLVAGDGERLLLAAQGYREAGRPLPRAKALEAAAIAFVHSGQSSSARAAATRCLDLYAELGADRQLARAQSGLRALGIRRGPHVKHRRAKVGWESLTPAEATIAALVVKGLSNPQIAEQLFVSRRTVTTHVSHILAKLGVRTRTDIAREASLRRLASG
ncbi:ATP-binding protein [Kutzneria albida]|uniref:ATP-binding protein n=1 Tax=Kutzneria albida TaxID=43357 RepID=UPI0023B8517C|nr:LuxR family transcriptional regulator [Kutzneria albida]